MIKMICLILGGGAGSRLYPLTEKRSKPAVPIGGKYRLIDIPISNCINSGVKRMFVLTQYNSASLNAHIKNAYNFDHFTHGFVDILAADLRVHLFQRRIISGAAEEGVSGQQRTGADTADDIELRPLSPFAPADEEPCTKGTVLAATRKRKHVQGMPALALNVAYDSFARNVRDVGIDARTLGRIQRFRPIGERRVKRCLQREGPLRRR